MPCAPPSISGSAPTTRRPKTSVVIWRLPPPTPAGPSSHVLADNGISGIKGRDHRPGFDQLHKLIVRREIDVVMAWSVDRLGRSLQDLVAFLGELRAVGCDLYLHQQGVDTTTPAGRAMFQMLGVFAEFERAIIVERVKAGIARARAAGEALRPAVRRWRDRAGDPGRARHRQGHPQGCRECGVGVSVVQRIRAITPARAARHRRPPSRLKTSGCHTSASKKVVEAAEGRQK